MLSSGLILPSELENNRYFIMYSFYVWQFTIYKIFYTLKHSIISIHTSNKKINKVPFLSFILLFFLFFLY